MRAEKDHKNLFVSSTFIVNYEDDQIRAKIPAILDTGAQLSIVGKNVVEVEYHASQHTIKRNKWT